MNLTLKIKTSKKLVKIYIQNFLIFTYPLILKNEEKLIYKYIKSRNFSLRFYTYFIVLKLLRRFGLITGFKNKKVN